MVNTVRSVHRRVSLIRIDHACFLPSGKMVGSRILRTQIFFRTSHLQIDLYVEFKLGNSEKKSVLWSDTPRKPHVEAHSMLAHRVAGPIKVTEFRLSGRLVVCSVLVVSTRH